MNPKNPEGQYRTKPAGGQAPMVYVWGSRTSSYVTEAAYRAKGYSPNSTRFRQKMSMKPVGPKV